METRLIVVLVIAGVCMLVIWYINGALVTPVAGGKNLKIEICVKAAGSAPELEQTVCGLLWLIENGTLPGEIVIQDDAMDDYTRLTAQKLAGDDYRIHVKSIGETWNKTES